MSNEKTTTDVGKTSELHANKEYKISSAFSQCLKLAKDTTEYASSVRAKKIKLFSRRIDDSHFRLHMWSADLAFDWCQRINPEELQVLKDSSLPGLIMDTFQGFEARFTKIRIVLEKIKIYMSIEKPYVT
ncbi:hypothetical protein MMC28_006400 [Mycoblastus sanguinarius]|nr:hypothetical protein [Mycoblastus sanguinarius]